MEDRLTELERRLVRAERRGRALGALTILALMATLFSLGIRPAATQTPGAPPCGGGDASGRG